MEKLDEVVFYTLEKSIRMYRKYAQSQIHKNGFDITIDQWLILKTLQETKCISQREIAELVFKDFASITRIIELLVQKNYLRRRTNATDRRKFELEITEAGDKIIEDIYPIVVAYRAQALIGLTNTEINDLKTQLEKLITNCK